ncbi:MAG: hypothetical protein HS117_23595 [Verrucomicrobiaceae bacterium]|nr:hypothetical protein [Verrucomicrobiaceae bacterium]
MTSPDPVPPQSLVLNGKQTTIHHESGVLCGLNKQTDIHGTGANIHSAQRAEFALMGADGIERPRQFMSHQVFLRNGHRVSLLWVEHSGQKRWINLVNHDTRETWICWPEPHRALYEIGIHQKFGCWSWLLWFVSIYLGAVASAGIDKSGNLGAIALLIGYPCLFAFGIWRSWSARRTWKKSAKVALECYGETVLQNTDAIFSWASLPGVR